MKQVGGLTYVTGPMGSGKSLYGVRTAVRYLMAKQYVVTNVELYPDAPERIAKHYAPASRRNRARIADKVRRFYVFEQTLGEAIHYRVPGKGESRALFLWDEGHNDLNNRNWRERQKSYANARGTDELLEWATQLRKLGYAGLLLSQHADNTDAALRRVANYHVRLQNQKNETRLLGLQITPWPLFLAYWYQANGGEKGRVVPPFKTERYFLSWHRHLYDTHGLYHGLAQVEDEDDRRVYLPAEGLAAPKALPAPADVVELPPSAFTEVA